MAASLPGSRSAAPKGCITSGYEVGDIEEALRLAQQQGAKLRACKACKVEGSHPHPEGFVAFLDNDAAGIEIEMMQVYTPKELDEYNAVKGI